MDPVIGFGVTSGAMGVVSLGITVAQGLLKFYTSVKDARHDIIRLYNTTQQLLISLSHLQGSLQKIKNLDSIVQEAEKQILCTRSSIEQLEAMLASDKFKMTPVAGSSWPEKLKAKGRTALYPFRESTLANLREIIEDVLECLDLALKALQL
jgi:ankyrin repeat domain-containing protein 50